MALPLLDGADEFARLQQAVMRAGIEPGIAARHAFDLELAEREIGVVDVGDLELASRRGLHRGGDVEHAVVVEIEPLVRSIRARTSYPNLEIVVADNGDFGPTLTEELTRLGVRIVHYAGTPFNLSQKMNLVVGATSGDDVVLLDDDMSVISEDWVTEMLMWCQQDGVSEVGAKLLFPDHRLQHVGMLLLGQGPSHPYYLHDRSEIGQVRAAIVPRDYSAVTGACMMVRRADHLAVGGFDPAFRINYNDVDFCLKLNRHTGGRFVFTPYASLYHYESVSRPEAVSEDLGHFNARWAGIVGQDPHYNLHLSHNSNRFEISSHIADIEDSYDVDC